MRREVETNSKPFVIPDKFIYSYSFALHPEDNRPGTINISRASQNICIFGQSFNTINIARGLGGLSYAD